MIPDPGFVLATLVLAHLVADFVLQTESMAVGKFGDGPAAWQALLRHVAVVAIVNAPLAIVFGLPGVVYVIVTAVTHLVIDRSKIVLTRRVEPRRPGGGGPTAEEAAAGPTMDRAWTPIPGALFAADQLMHLGVLALSWVVLLSGTAPTPFFADLASRLPITSDPRAFHWTVLCGVVLASLLIVNVRAASMFVDTLVRPPQASGERRGPPTARIGAVIGVLERLLICALILGNAVAGIGLVIAAKTLARFKQLEDREFAEYYLLGTLASVTVAVVTSLIAQAVLASP